MRIGHHIAKCVGGTCPVLLNRLKEGTTGRVDVKLESSNPLSSLKDRISEAMIHDAEK